MRIYIDKPNLLSIIHSPRGDKYSDCIRMLKKNFTIFFTFAIDDIKTMNSNDKNDIMLWLSQMTTGIGLSDEDHVRWNCGFPSRPIDISTFKTDELSSVYCLSKECDPKLEAQANRGNLLIACEGQEINAMSSLFFEDYQFNQHIFYEILSWDDLGKYTSPCTDIIIADPYLFSSPDLYQSNIYALIKVLTKTIKNSKVNIVIFTLKDNYDKNTKINFEPDWDTIYSKIRKCAEKHSSFNVTFVTANKDTLEEHDRTIFTNYKYFASGDTYNYFSSTGEKLTKGRNFHVHSLASKSNDKNAKTFIEDMQKIIDRIKEKNNERLIKKDKISNFLKF